MLPTSEAYYNQLYRPVDEMSRLQINFGSVLLVLSRGALDHQDRDVSTGRDFKLLFYKIIENNTNIKNDDNLKIY